MSHGLRIGAVGWDHRGWVGGFYPETLPEDWWLTYYSNEFDCVLLAAEDWCSADPDQWRQDTPETFRFFLQLSAADRAWLDPLPEIAGALQARLGGIVAGPGLDPAVLNELKGQVPVYAHARPAGAAGGGVWRPGGATVGCALGILAPGDVPDRRALSARIQEFAGQVDGNREAALLLEGAPPDIAALQDAVVIAGLLGL